MTCGLEWRTKLSSQPAPASKFNTGQFRNAIRKGADATSLSLNNTLTLKICTRPLLIFLTSSFFRSARHLVSPFAAEGAGGAVTTPITPYTKPWIWVNWCMEWWALHSYDITQRHMYYLNLYCARFRHVTWIKYQQRPLSNTQNRKKISNVE